MNNREDRTFWLESLCQLCTLSAVLCSCAQLTKAFKPKCPVLSIVHTMYIAPEVSCDLTKNIAMSLYRFISKCTCSNPEANIYFLRDLTTCQITLMVGRTWSN